MAINEMDARLISQGSQVTSVNGDALVPVAAAEGQPQKNITLSNFADSMANAVPQQTSDQIAITGLYAKTTDGKMVELTKESVASVMAGLFEEYDIPSNMQMFKSSYTFKSGIDANEASENVYIVNGVNLPEGYSAGYLEVLWTKATGRICQRFVDTNTATPSVFFTRVFDGSTWSAWRRIDNFGYNSLEDLSSGVGGFIGYGVKYKQIVSDDELNSLDGNFVGLWGDVSIAGGKNGSYIHIGGSSGFQAVFVNDGIKLRMKRSGTWSNWFAIS